MATTVRTQVSRSARPVSWAAIMTLRTNGERGDQCNFIADSRALFQFHVDADHVAAVKAFADKDEAAGAVGDRAVDNRDRRIEWQIETFRRLHIGGPDRERLPCVLDLETGDIRDQPECGLRLQILFRDAPAQALVDMQPGEE